MPFAANGLPEGLELEPSTGRMSGVPVRAWEGAICGVSASSPGRFLFYALLTFVVAGAFTVIAMLYRYRNPAKAMGGEVGSREAGVGSGERGA